MILRIIKGDLFTTEDHCIAHCVSSDLRLGKGIAKEVKRRYPNLPFQALLGRAYAMQNGDMLVYHLITKVYYYGKPTYDTLRSSLISMRDQLGEIDKISMPAIGCGLDRVVWDQVLEIIKEVFMEKELTITIYLL